MKENNTQQVPSIRDGTVIDHIPSKITLDVLQILNLGDELITLGSNLASSKIGLKGLVKVSDKHLTKQELDKIAIVAPKATISIIKDFKVVEKFKLDIPSKLSKIVKCLNTNCITNHEEVPTLFIPVSTNPVTLKCHYCESVLTNEEIVLL